MIVYLVEDAKSLGNTEYVFSLLSPGTEDHHDRMNAKQRVKLAQQSKSKNVGSQSINVGADRGPNKTFW